MHHVVEQWGAEAPGLDRTAFAVIGRINRLSRILEGRLEPSFTQRGLSAGEFDVLAALRRTGTPYRLRPSELSRALIVTSGGMTKRLHALERRGLVARTGDENDRRARAVTLTQRGRRLTDTVLEEHAANEARLLAGIDQATQLRFADLLAQLAVALGDIGSASSTTDGEDSSLAEQ